MGPIDDQLVLGKWASLHTGKYDANDTFGLVAFDSECRHHGRLEGVDAGRGRRRLARGGRGSGDSGSARRIHRGDRARLAHVDAGVAGAARTARGRTQRGVHRPRRRRLRAGGLLRLGDRHAQHRRARRAGRASRQLPHRRALLADAQLPAHRAQPPHQRHGPRRRPRHGLPRVLGHGAARERVPLRDPAHAGLLHVRGGEVAPHARRRDAHGGRPQQLADRPRLRPVVRLPRW